MLKLNRFIEGAALRTTGAIHIGIVRVNETAFLTAKDVVGAGGRTEAFLPALVINADATKAAEEYNYITGEKRGNGHVKAWRGRY